MIDLKHFDVDWSLVNKDIRKELFGPRIEPSDHALRMAREFERKVFTFCLVMGISKVYVLDEDERTSDGMWRMEWRLDDRPPVGRPFTEYDFSRLLNMSDEEFAKLPESTNTGLVNSWREMLKSRSPEGHGRLPG